MMVIKEKNGIIFITGGTGMGKTTTMAAILNEINKTRNIHILTLEDPIEFRFTPIKSTFSQRELGRDFFSFQKGMRAAMRQAPKVIFIGEIRDRETDGDCAQRRRKTVIWFSARCTPPAPQ